MELFKGTHGKHIIVDGYSGRISFYSRKKNWFDGSCQETTITFSLSALDKVTIEKPTGWFKSTRVTLKFDFGEDGTRVYDLEIPWYADQRQGHRLFRAVQEIQRNFT